LKNLSNLFKTNFISIYDNKYKLGDGIFDKMSNQDIIRTVFSFDDS